MTLARMQQRRDSAADWTSSNPVLAEGEIGWETDTKRLKIGDGTTAWTSLAYSPSTITVKRVKRTSGNITLNSTSWANVDTGLDITFTGVSAGDWVDYSTGFLLASAAVNVNLDVCTVVSGSPVNYLGAAGGGSDVGGMCWYSPASVDTPVSGTIAYQVQSGDLSAGSLTLRLRYRSASATNRTLQATSTNPCIVSARHYR